MDDSESESIIGYKVIKSGLNYCIDTIMDWIQNGDRCRYLACINPHSYVEAIHNQLFSDALNQADWLIPDGIGIVIGSRLLRGHICARVTGPDVFKEVHDRLNSIGGASVFFLGSTENSLGLICNRMKCDYPNIRIAGIYSPPFKPEFSDEDTDSMVMAINAAAPDVLWVGMTSPKQDVWIHKNRHRLNVKFAAGVGAAFDFYTGRVKRPHPYFQKLGLGWLPRLIREPRRLWRRTFISAPLFLFYVFRAMVLKRGL